MDIDSTPEIKRLRPFRRVTGPQTPQGDRLEVLMRTEEDARKVTFSTWIMKGNVFIDTHPYLTREEELTWRQTVPTRREQNEMLSGFRTQEGGPEEPPGTQPQN